MSEEILEKSAEAGAGVVGGVGGVTDPSAGNMGFIAGAQFGEVPSDYSGAEGGGVLRPEQSRRFIDYIWDAMVWAREGRRVTMAANTAELNKMGVGERVIKAAAQADDTYTNAGVRFTKIELTTTKIRLDWEVSTEALEDNIEKGALEDHIAQQMTAQFGQDLEDLAINGDGSADPSTFHGILKQDGFLLRYTDKMASRGGTPVWNGTDELAVEHYQKLITSIPRKWRGVKTQLKFYASTDAFVSTVNGLGVNGSLDVEALRAAVVSGAAPSTIGAPVRYTVLGLPLVEVPLLGEDGEKIVICTFPQNNIWGFQRDVTVHREFKPKKDTTEYTVYARFGVAVEEDNASSVLWDGASGTHS
jgi:hypothetical protein